MSSFTKNPVSSRRAAAAEMALALRRISFFGAPSHFHLQGENVQEELEAYIKFFIEERPAYSLGYLTPKQYRETYAAIQ